MRTTRSVPALLFSALATCAAAWAGTPDAQRALERQYDTHLDAADLRAWLERMSAEPTHVGAPHNKANAEFMQQLLQSWGWDAEIETFAILYPTLVRHSLELLAPTRFVASLKEPAIEGDAAAQLMGASNGE